MPLVDMFSHINALKPWNPNHEIMSGLVHVNLPDFGRQAFREQWPMRSAILRRH